jgi:hypothetical protein
VISIGEAWSDMQIDHGDLPRSLRIAVGHRHHRRFLQRQHVAEITVNRERIHERKLGRSGVTEQDVHALLLQKFQKRALAGNRWHEGLHFFADCMRRRR